MDVAEVVSRYVAGESMTSLAHAFRVRRGSISKVVREAGALRSVSAQRILNWAPVAQIRPEFSFLPLRPETAWMIGLIFGNGCLIQNRVTISHGDRDVLEKVNSLLGGGLTVKRDSRSNKCFTVALCSKTLVDQLAQFALYRGKKADILVYPQMAKALVPHFVRGLLDTDGWWTTPTVQRKYRYLWFGYASVSQGFVSSLRAALIEHVGVSDASSVTCRKPNSPVSKLPLFEIHYGHADSIQIGKWMYADSSNETRCKRKYETWDSFR